MILALENSLHFCSLALADPSGRLIVQKNIETQTRHSETLLACLDDFFSEQSILLKNVSVLVYGRGPGSFTGVRIVAAISHAIALALDIPVYAASSLAALALSVPVGSHVLSLLDARLGEVYWAAYRRDETGLVSLASESAAEVDVVADWIRSQPETDWWILGNGGPLLVSAYPALANQSSDFERAPLAYDLLPLVDWHVAPSEEATFPVYLKADRPWRRS